MTKVERATIWEDQGDKYSVGREQERWWAQSRCNTGCT